MTCWCSMSCRIRRPASSTSSLCARATRTTSSRTRKRKPEQGLGLRAPHAVEGCELLVRELDRGSADVLLQMRHLAGARNRQHDGAALQEPGERDLSRARLMLVGDGVQRRTWLRRRAGVERRPGDEADPVFLAIVERRLAVAVDEVIA